ncbi:NADH-ubiquinone/plastoquinone oxidoreductase chain 4L [delta proteobacterium NaphS2]|nr:NADH-ubiquinone/plastoquinone oxidoreductase chain 4L [delta proteobacterium NaphS2]
MLFQLVGVFLFSVGIAGLVRRKTLVGMLIALELMINGAGLSIVAAAQLTSGDAVKGQLAALFVMGLAAAEATLLLAIILVAVRRLKSSGTDGVFHMRG